jgi:hypothetical protein
VDRLVDHPEATERRLSVGEAGGALTTVFLYVAAAVPFVPGAWQFLERGVPDVLFTGDGAALELGTLHASHGTQLVGPYSRFVWSHPGPLFFYLAVPVYEAFGRRGPALNLFVFVANLAIAFALVLTARRLRGELFALVVAALLAVYALVGVPSLLTNEWNPVFPILPLALLAFLAVHLGLESTTLLPVFAFVASLIVQTHVAYAPEVLALSALVVTIRHRLAARSPDLRPRPTARRTWLATGAVLTVCWVLPLYEAATSHPGNLQRLVAFFAPRHLTEHPWSVAASTVFDQMAVMPLALARTVHIPAGPPRWSVTLTVAIAQLVALVAVLFAASRRRDAGLATLSTVTLVQIAVALLAVRAIRGDIYVHLVIWISLLGLMSSVTLAAWLVTATERSLGPRPARAIVGLGSIVLLGLAVVGEPVPRGPVFRQPDLVTDQLARSVETYLRSAQVDRPTIRIASHESWPAAVAVVLYLYKRDIPVSVERDWIFMVGRPFAESPGEHPRLLVGNSTLDQDARTRRDLTFVAASGDVHVYLEDPGHLPR